MKDSLKSLKSDTYTHPLLGMVRGNSKSKTEFVAEWDMRSIPFLKDYKILDYFFFPGAGLIEIALSAGKEYFKSDDVQLENMQIFTTLILEKNKKKEIKTFIKKEEDNINISIFSVPDPIPGRVSQEWSLHGRFILSPNVSKLDKGHLFLKNAQDSCKQKLDPSMFYNKLSSHMITYGPTFQSLEGIYFGEEEAVGAFRNRKEEHPPYLCHPTLLYGSFQLFTALLAKKAEESDYKFILVPCVIRKISYFSAKGYPKYTYVKLNLEKMSTDIYLFNQEHEIVLVIQDFEIAKLSRLELLKNLNSENGQELNKTEREGIIEHISKKLSLSKLDSDFFYDICAFIIIKATRVLDLPSRKV